MQNIQNDKDKTEKELAILLHKKNMLSGPTKKGCNSTNFVFQTDLSNKTSDCYFRRCNYKSRNKYQIRINSIFSEFPFHKLKIIYEIIICFLCYEFNVEKVIKYLDESKNYKILKPTLLNI